VLLARRAHEPFVGMWEVPGGFVDRGEHPVDAAVRELQRSWASRWSSPPCSAPTWRPAPTGECLEITCYLGTTAGEPVANPAEVGEWAWFGPDQVPEVMAGRDRERVLDWAAGRAVPLPADGR
jgi:ADP-ribose pyrophosphatase YjhB (NUDIX family)